MLKLQSVISIVLFVVLPFILMAQNVSDKKDPPKDGHSIQNVRISGQWFLTYLNGDVSGENVNLFTIRRGYINVNSKFNDTFSGRITPDVSVDQEGDGAGDVELRLKYCYLQWNLPQLSIFTNPYIEFGIVHRPWLDFEEHINRYRVQGTMYLERNGIFNSADYGATFFALLGGEMDEEYQKKVNKNHPGLYGSIALGIYNGGGYHAIENNNDKTIESRISIRPFPFFIPGFQMSYNGTFGKGNTIEEPDWIMHAGFLSWNHETCVVAGTYYTGVGNFKGTAVDSLGNVLDQNGFSIFGEYKIPALKMSLIGRYDFFRQEKYGENQDRKRYIIGIAYYFYKSSKVLLDFDRNEGESSIGKNTSRIELAVEVKF